MKLRSISCLNDEKDEVHCSHSYIILQLPFLYVIHEWISKSLESKMDKSRKLQFVSVSRYKRVCNYRENPWDGSVCVNIK